MSSETTIEFKDDQFWTNDTGILIKKDRLIEFVPTKDMTKDERLNAIARMSVYIGIVLMLYLAKVCHYTFLLLVLHLQCF